MDMPVSIGHKRWHLNHDSSHSNPFHSLSIPFSILTLSLTPSLQIAFSSLTYRDFVFMVLGWVSLEADPEIRT